MRMSANITPNALITDINGDGKFNIVLSDTRAFSINPDRSYTPAWGGVYSWNSEFGSMKNVQWAGPYNGAELSARFDRERWSLIGDTNGDNKVNLVDFVIVRDNLGTTGLNLPGDTNADGVVDLTDYRNVRANYGRQY